MKKIFLLFMFTVCTSLSACGGGGGTDAGTSSAPTPSTSNTPSPTNPPAEAVCSFSFNSISNGASARLANSYWSCHETNGSSSANYNLVFFEDGAGALSSTGDFTWRETACAQAEATTTQGKIEIQNITGSKSSTVLTFDSTPQNGTLTHHTCSLEDLTGVPSNENEVTPPASIPSTTAPTGTENNGAVLSNPSYAGTLYSVFAANGQFLGVINDNPFDPNSLCNPFGNYGSKFSASSIWNQFGDYGSNFATYSAFNNFTSTAPVIFANTQALAFLSSNATLSPRLDSTYLLNLLVANGCRVSR